MISREDSEAVREKGGQGERSRAESKEGEGENNMKRQSNFKYRAANKRLL